MSSRSDRDETVQDRPGSAAAPDKVWLGVLLACAALGTALWQPTLGGAFLLMSAVKVRRSPPRLLPRNDGSYLRYRPMLDLAFIAALVVPALLKAKREALQGSSAWILLGLLPLIMAVVLAVLPTNAKRVLSTVSVGSGLARLLLGALLTLTPVAWVLGISSDHWGLTALMAWGVVQVLGPARRLLMHVDSTGVVKGSRLILSGRGSALRNAAAALTATGLDFALFSSLAALAWCTPPVATLLGAAAGGIVNFTVNRTWTFDASGSNRTMARRYVMVSGTSAALNASLVLVLLWIPGQNVTIVWLVARGLVFLGWNYPLHRDYVFAHGGRQAVAGH